MRKTNLCYDQNKNKWENIPNWKNKRRENFEQKKKGTMFYKNSRNNYQGYWGEIFKNYKQENPTTIKEK